MAAIVALTVPAAAQGADPVADLLAANQFDLASDGTSFLLKEGERASFLLLGGIHGDNETQALVGSLFGGLANAGYRFIHVEMSPWAAARLVESLGGAVPLRGGDIEEVQPHLLIRELASSNPGNQPLQSMAEKTKGGYTRTLAPELLQLLRNADPMEDPRAGGISLRRILTATLEVEVDRAKPETAFAASVRRERFMKELFAEHYRDAARNGSKPKALAVFGRNHLHRGYDRRGVATLGNFIAEFAVAEGGDSFHVALFAAGGRINTGGLRSLDERDGDPAFTALAAAARYPATVFDLRPLRWRLRSGPVANLSARDAALLYWADSYDAIVCYREVTPLGNPGASRGR